MTMYDLYTIITVSHKIQGLEGPVKFSGTSPVLGDFTMRIVDRKP